MSDCKHCFTVIDAEWVFCLACRKYFRKEDI